MQYVFKSSLLPSCMIPKKMAKASFRVDDEVLRAFRAAVARKHGSLWRYCGLEVSIALRERTAEIDAESDGGHTT